ncbi:MAG TPA: condensation domain-containing protein [Pyrinomonadaceae bacterium]|nr:condensation domain-containing protein [Pyrinomonadaceae bacterium]
MSSEESFDNSANCEVAIIGLAGRFPGARNTEEFWENLKNGVEGISFFADDELEDPQELLNPALVKAKGTLTGVELFDAPFFDISKREAELMDPQQRLFLEASWTALEDAGYDVSSYPGLIAVYAGVSTNTYLLTRMAQLNMSSPAEHYSIVLANEKDYLATRVSYKLNLRGESITIQTSCSTSLVAVHLACQSLLSGQCDMALAGGVSIGFPQKTGYFYQEGMILSPDGHCRPFDQKAQGIVPGHGLGVVVLKLLSEAIKDGDNIRAVIKGSAINNDGHLKMGYTAPSLEGQTDVIAKALAMAGVESESVTYVEAHGTGTPIGDPIEIEALTRAFRRHTEKKAFCALGAVKSNIGHLDSAAGIAGLIKTVLALEHKQIPPTLHFEKPNPMIDFENSPFRVNQKLVDWRANGFPRRAGVSSFGIGGTNAHVVVEEAPAPAKTSATTRDVQLITLSARTESAVSTMAEKLAQHLDERRDSDLRDVAYTLNVGRQTFAHRRFVVARDREEAVAALRRQETPVQVAAQKPQVVFMFPGQGALSVEMARVIYEREGEFRKQFEECAAWLRQQHDIDLQSLLYPDGAEARERAAKLLAQPRFALPALFTIEYALAKLWMSWGINPQAMIGHSFGEYAAACLAGVFTLNDALSVVVTRGRLMQQLPPGAMSVVRLGAAEVEQYLEGDVSISAINSGNVCTVTGPTEQIEKLERALSDNRIAFQRLDVPYAYHSAMVEAILPEFEAAVSRVTLRAPSIPYISNLTGTWITAEEVVTPNYWTMQMRRTVRFAPGIETLLSSGHSAFVEIGSGQTLSPLLKSYSKRERVVVVASLSHSPNASDEMVMFKALGQLWQAGVRIDWSGFYRSERRRRLSLPTYPFERQRYWIETPRRESVSQPVTDSAVTTDVSPEAVVAAPQPNGHASMPLNELEKTLAGIWSEVLGLTNIDLDDSFFDLGGDSLLATQVHSRIKQALPVSISLQQLFEHQTLRQLAELVRQSTQGETAKQYLPVQPVPRDGRLPLSFTQEWFWLLDQLEPGSAAYNLPAAVRLEGPLNIAALHRSFNEIVRRHEILRTSFQAVDGQPVQVITPAASLDFPIVDLAEIPPAERERIAHELIAAEVSRPFDLSTAPMIRTGLLRLGEQEHVALCTVHHIAFDAWSGGVLIQELSALYEAFSKAEPSPLAELPIQYADYASWQRQFLQGEVLEKQLSYWKNQLAGAPPLLNLPTDRPRPSVPSYRGAREPFRLPAELSAKVKELSRSEGVTLFMLLLAAFQTLLGRYSKQDDVCVGMSIAGRNRVEFEGLIGCFLNTLVLRTQLPANLRFRELLQRVRETTLQAYAHQELPLEKLIEVLKPERNAGYMPLYQVLLDVINTPGGQSRETPGLVMSPMVSDTATAKLDLLLDVWESGDSLGGLVEYKTDLFDRETIVKMLGHFETLLANIVADPDARLSSLEMRTEAEKQQELMAQAERATARHQKFINVKPKAMTP